MEQITIQAQKKLTQRTFKFPVQNEADVNFWLWNVKTLGEWHIVNYEVK